MAAAPARVFPTGAAAPHWRSPRHGPLRGRAPPRRLDRPRPALARGDDGAIRRRTGATTSARSRRAPRGGGPSAPPAPDRARAASAVFRRSARWRAPPRAPPGRRQPAAQNRAPGLRRLLPARRGEALLPRSAAPGTRALGACNPRPFGGLAPPADSTLREDAEDGYSPWPMRNLQHRSRLWEPHGRRRASR